MSLVAWRVLVYLFCGTLTLLGGLCILLALFVDRLQDPRSPGMMGIVLLAAGVVGFGLLRWARKKMNG